MTKLIATTALALCLGTAAFAQSGTASGPSTSGTGKGGATGSSGAVAGTETRMPSGWSGAIANAFFAGGNMTTPRPDSEIKQNWASLTGQQKAQVKADCQKVASGAEGTNTETDTYSRTGQMDTGTTNSESTGGSGSTGRDGEETTATTATGNMANSQTANSNRSGGNRAVPSADGVGQQLASIRQVCGSIKGL